MHEPAVELELPEGTLHLEIINRYPHDPTAFTQGLIYRDGRLYESTGLHGQSSLRHVDLETGATIESVALADRYFGEGSNASVANSFSSPGRTRPHSSTTSTPSLPSAGSPTTAKAGDFANSTLTRSSPATEPTSSSSDRDYLVNGVSGIVG